MIYEKLCFIQNKKFLLAMVLIIGTLVCVQYHLNYYFTDICLKNDKYVKKIVERVYVEVLPSIKPANVVDQKIQRSNELIERKKSQHKICTPEKYILFLKTHKTGSSTITNILNRYVDEKKLTMLLPKSLDYYSFEWPNKFRLAAASNTFTRPNVLANHARYSRKSMNVLFPRESTIYISILRHPVSQFESTFQYMSFPYILGIRDKVDPLSFFLENPPSLENIQSIARQYPSLYLIRNPLFFDLGLDHKDYENSTIIRIAMKTLDNDFDLVLITEHFDESLTLLRRRLCWSVDDIVHFRLNERLNKNKRRILTENQVQKIKNWNNADMALYNYYLEKFWREIKDEGPGFYDDVRELKEKRNYYKSICIEKEAVEEAYSSVYVKGYLIRSNLTGFEKKNCERLLRNEIKYMDYFRNNRSAWIKRIEGTTIKNFDDSLDEADIFLEFPDIKYTKFTYEAQKNELKKMKVIQKPLNGMHNILGPPTDESDENNSNKNKINRIDKLTSKGSENIVLKTNENLRSGSSASLNHKTANSKRIAISDISNMQLTNEFKPYSDRPNNDNESAKKIIDNNQSTKSQSIHVDKQFDGRTILSH